MSKRSKKEQRSLEASRTDEECLLQETIERDLEEEVRRLWKASRRYLGHEDWTEYEIGCNCNRYIRHELQHAINRLRAWRTRREYCV